MIDWVLDAGLNNGVLSLALGILAWSIQRHGRRPFAAHMVWLACLVALLLPPIWTIPLVDWSHVEASDHSTVNLARGAEPLPLGNTWSTWVETASVIRAEHLPSSDEWGRWLVGLWALGSLVVLGVSVSRVLRFGGRLSRMAEPVTDELTPLAEELAARFGFTRTPRVVVTEALLSPHVFWAGGRVRVVLPRALVEGVSRADLRSVLAHEFSHVKRRDYLVRWLEWAACVVNWWNPVAWWAQRRLRTVGELCCDAYALERLEMSPASYARALLNAVECLSGARQPSARVASAFSSGHLERRLRALFRGGSRGRAQRRLGKALGLVAFLLVPFGIVGDSNAETAVAAVPMTRLMPATRVAVPASEAHGDFEGQLWAWVSAEARHSESPADPMPSFETFLELRNGPFTERERRLLGTGWRRLRRGLANLGFQGPEQLRRGMAGLSLLYLADDAGELDRVRQRLAEQTSLTVRQLGGLERLSERVRVASARWGIH